MLLSNKLYYHLTFTCRSLADINGDGKLDLYEFSIACKLINLKLRGLNLPPSLPPQLKQSACNAPSAPSAQAGLGGLMSGPIPGGRIIFFFLRDFIFKK